MALDVLTLGARVKEARERASLTQAALAAATSLDRSALAKVELGTRRVSALELARIADAVGSRIEWFVEEAPAAIVSHRNREAPGAASPTVDVLLERLARNTEFLQNQDHALQLLQFNPLERPSSDAAADEAASSVRSFLDLDDRQPVLDIASHAPNAGLLLFSVDLGPDTADAASIALRTGGVALVNGFMQVGRRRLAAAHELGHHVFADEYAVDWRLATNDDNGPWEARLDRFARALLLPAAGAAASWRELHETSENLRITAVRMASQFRVDMTTLSRRLSELELVTSSEAQTIRQVRTTKADIVEYNLIPRDELAAPALPDVYVKAVLHLYRADSITGERAIDLLLNSWPEDELPDRPRLRADAIWDFVS